jgi:ribonuclease HI
MDRPGLERYLRLTGATLRPRGAKEAAHGDGAAWIEALSNGRFLVCEMGLRWHPARTQAEARRLVERLRFEAAHPSVLTAEWVSERAERFRANPSDGCLALRAALDDLGLAFTEQAVIGWRIADFLVEDRLILEVDGPVRRSRKAALDALCRDEALESRGFRVLRLDEAALLTGPGAALGEIGRVLDDLALAGGDKPSLEPPPSGEARIDLFTDGGCSPNPGAGGYGVVLACAGRRRELSGGFALTTNNRMEIFAAIAGLEALQKPGCLVTVYSDSRYLIDAIEKGWARKWRRNQWMRTPEEKAKNADLWERLLAVLDRHRVTFQWVKGHAGHPENERCDQLAGAALARKDLPEDPGFKPDPRPEA